MTIMLLCPLWILNSKQAGSSFSYLSETTGGLIRKIEDIAVVERLCSWNYLSPCKSLYLPWLQECFAFIHRSDSIEFCRTGFLRMLES